MLVQDLQNQFRDTLRLELVRRCRSNSAYSMRAYSKSLGLESAFLSKLLSGQRSITPKTVKRLAPHLGLSPHQLERFSGRYFPPDLPAANKQLNSLPEDAFRCISDWYHFAILELFTVDGFKPSAAYIARRLGISRVFAQDALLRLERLQLIQKNKKGVYILRNGENTTVNYPDSTDALRKMQKQILEMAVLALENVSMVERDQSTMTMAMDYRQMSEAKVRIKKFRRELCEYLQQTKSRNSVYQLTISLYPVARAEI